MIGIPALRAALLHASPGSDFSLYPPHKVENALGGENRQPRTIRNKCLSSTVSLATLEARNGEPSGQCSVTWNMRWHYLGHPGEASAPPRGKPPLLVLLQPPSCPPKPTSHPCLVVLVGLDSSSAGLVRLGQCFFPFGVSLPPSCRFHPLGLPFSVSC